MELVLEKTKNGKTLKIYQDSDGCDPREDDNLCKMVCFTKSYDLGDKDHGYKSEDQNSFDELYETIMAKEKPVAILPIYMYSHSGITINTTGYSCQWDSGQIGWAYITNKKIDEMGTTLKDGESWTDYVARLKEYIVGEVKHYDDYITGDVYRFEYTDENGEEDSCGGFFGTDWKTNGLADHVDKELLDEL